MAYALILLTISLILNVFQKYDAELNLIPRDTEVMVNDLIYMNCSTSLEAEKVQWRHGNNYVYAGRNILEPYNVRFSVKINSSTGTNNLVIRSVQPSDAGQYECLEDEGFGERSSAHLIVLDRDPVCSNMHPSGVIGPNNCGVEPEEIKLSCVVKYHGYTFPVLQWKVGGINKSITGGLVNITSNKNVVTYILTLNSTFDLSHPSIVFQTMRAVKRNYNCSFDVIKILYISSSKVTIKMTMNDKVSCFANTSQSCSYKWKWFSGNDSITVSYDHVLIPDRVGWHRCEATCSLGYKSCIVEPMYAEVYSTPAPSGQNLLALWVLFALAVIVLIGVVMYYRRKIQREREVERRNWHLWRILFDWPTERKEEFERKQEEEWQRLIEMQQRLNERERDFERKLQEERQRLTATLPEKYKLDPDFVQAIATNAAEEQKKKARGLTILDKELFVVRDESSEVEVYDSEKLSLSRQWILKKLIDPCDIGSCNRNKCLYIIDYKSDGKSKEILRVNPNGELIKYWPIGSDCGWGLSVTDERNLILTVFFKAKLNEYSPDGQLIREINLSLNADIRHPFHAIKLTNGHFVVSHGSNDDDLHRVCEVDGDGNLTKTFDGKCGSPIRRMNLPNYLAVDEKGFVMVADRYNSRVLLLDSALEFRKEILSKEKWELSFPQKLLLGQTNNRLFVLDEEGGGNRISIFDFKY